jgi:spermidine synthase
MNRASHLCLFGILLAYFLSGVAALSYQVLWVRFLTPLFGNTTLSVTIVLSTFMLGLAVGNILGGHLSRMLTPKKVLMAFALAEISIAITAFLFERSLPLVNSMVVPFASSDRSLVLQSSQSFLICVLLLFPTTLMMGTTFPLVCEVVLSIIKDGNGRWIGILYGVNTFGAVIGTALTGFFLIYHWGLTGTLLGTMAVNIMVAIIIVACLSLPEEVDGHSEERLRPSVGPSICKSLTASPFLAIILFLTGCASFICEVAWTRAFCLIIGSSTYAFSVMLITFLLGIALGGLLLSWAKRRALFPYQWLGGVLFLVALILILILPVFNRLPYMFISLFSFAVQSPLRLYLVQFVLCSMVMIGPAVLLGVSFPLILSEVAEKQPQPGLVTGVFSSVNTFGAILGASVAGLLLIPTLGVERTLVVASWVFALAGSLTILKVMTPSTGIRKFNGLLGGLFILMVAFHPRWDPYVLSSGVFQYAPEYGTQGGFQGFLRTLKADKLMFYEDGLSASVTVFEVPGGERFLRINGKTDASSVTDMMPQLLQGYLPLLLHNASPKSALVIGLGSGVTSGALATSTDLKTIRCVEIEPAVARAQVFFSDVNKNVTRDKRFHLLFTDARQFLSSNKEKFDVITSEPSNPWIAGVSSLYTKQAFETVTNRLASDGSFFQWFHGYAMGYEDFRMVLRTFADVFPSVRLFSTGAADYLLMGCLESHPIDYHVLEERFNSNIVLRSDLATLGITHPFSLLALTFVLDDDDVRRFCQGAPIHTDDHPILEFSAPHYLHRGENDKVSRSLAEARTRMLPKDLAGVNLSSTNSALLYNVAGEAFMVFRRLGEANDSFERALALDPKSARAWTNKARMSVMLNMPMRAEEAYNKAIQFDSRYALPWFHLGMLYLDQGLGDKGLAALEEGLKRSPGDPRGSIQVAQIYISRGRVQEARRLLLTVLQQPIPNQSFRSATQELLNSIEQSPR